MFTAVRCAVLFLIVLFPAATLAQDAGAAKPPDREGALDGLGRGAAIGALAALPLGLAQMTSCGTGCDWSSTPALLLGWALIGAAGGAAVGIAADLDESAPPSLRVGASYSLTQLTSSRLSGSRASPGFAAAVHLSRHITVHTEFTHVGHRFFAARGAVPDEVLRNVVADITRSRVAARSHGVESRRVDYMLTQLAGVRFAPFGRVRLEVLGGIGVQGGEERAYFDAYRDLSDGRTLPVPGKYYVLDFEAPEAGFVLGVDADVVLGHGLSLVPTLRYRAFADSSASLGFGAGIHWRVRR